MPVMWPKKTRKGVLGFRRMSRAQRNWTWAAGAGASLLIAIMGWAFAVSANSQTREESDRKYATKESVDLLRGDVGEIRGDVKELLRRNPRREYGPHQQ